MRPFPTNANYLAELRSLLALHRLWVAGKGESPEADAIRDASDGTWHALSEVEQKRLRGLSEDLNEICDYRPDAPIKEMNPQAQARFVEANEARQRGEWDRALELLRRWRQYITPALLAYLRGGIWYAAGDAETAAVFHEHAARVEPNMTKYQVRWLDVLQKADFAKAVAIAHEIMQNPDVHPPAVVVHAAHASIATTMTMSPPEKILFFTELLPVLERTLQELLTEEEVEQLEIFATLSFLGLAHEHVGNKTKAIEYYSRGIEIDPNDTALLIARGLLRYGSSPHAISDFELAIKLGSQDVWPYFFLAHEYLVNARFDDCRSICERGLRKAATDRVRSELFECLAISQAALVYPGEVVRNAFENALRADPSNERARRNLATYDRTLSTQPIRLDQWETRGASAVREDVQEEVRKTSRFPQLPWLLPAA